MRSCTDLSLIGQGIATSSSSALQGQDEDEMLSIIASGLGPNRRHITAT